MAVGKVAAHLSLIVIIKELKISVQHDRVVITLNTIFSVVLITTLQLHIGPTLILNPPSLQHMSFWCPLPYTPL